MRLTIEHHYDFGADRALVGDDLLNPVAWDGLRTQTNGLFAIPPTRGEFVHAAEGRAEIAARARVIDAWFGEQDAQIIASYGVGGAQLEWWLHRLRPVRELIVTDYGQATLERLTEVFPEARVRFHDLRRDGPIEADVHLFHRIDTELTDHEWHEVFRRYASVPVLMVATQVLDVRGVLVELRRRVPRNRRRVSHAGFIRTRSAFQALWQQTHSARPLRMHDLDAWSLQPRGVDPTQTSGPRE